MHTIYESKHLLLLEDDDWQFVERKKGKSAVAVIAVTEEGNVILTEQYRRPVQARVIDWPAGLVGDQGNDDPEKTAEQELEEETGYACESVELLASGPTSPGITSEIVSLYRARGVRKIGDGGGVGGEDITVHLVALREIEEWLKSREGVLIDPKLWSGLYFLTKARPALNVGLV